MIAPLAFRDVSFGYPGTRVFRDLALSVRREETMAVLGPNGSGKTTLVRLATRIVRAERGTITLRGDPVERLPRREIARRVAVVPQEERNLFAFSAAEAVLMGRTPWNTGFAFEGAADRRIAAEALAAVHAGGLSDRDLRSLSGGERQRVLFARALAQQADLLLLDEPTSHLDLRHQVEILRTIRALAVERGITAVLISHDVNLTARFADRLVLLGGGGVAAEGSPEEVLREDLLSEVYGTRVVVRRVPGIDVPQVFPA